MNSRTMCNCNDNMPDEFHNAFSDFGTSTPQEWRTSTRYDAAEAALEFPSTSSRAMRRDYRRLPQETSLSTTPRGRNFSGVAIVPRRIDFDAKPDDEQGDVGYSTTETVQRISSMTEHSYIPETTTAAAPGTYRLRRSRRAQRPPVMRQYAPRMTQMTPCGKCLRI